MPAAIAMPRVAAGAAAAGGCKQPWYKFDVDCCRDCFSEEWQPDFGPKTLLICGSCAAEAIHVGCYEKELGRTLDKEQVATSEWFCSEVSSDAPSTGVSCPAARWPLGAAAAANQRMPPPAVTHCRPPPRRPSHARRDRSASACTTSCAA